MKKIGITGSLASGKTTACKIISKNRGPIFSADTVVQKLYKRNSFKKLISNSFKISNSRNMKEKLRKIILEDKRNLQVLEKIIHPLVRKEMRAFTKKNNNKKMVFYEIPLLIESKLMKNFDTLIFIKSKKNIRLKRFISKGGNKKIFKMLNGEQLKESKKAKFCDYVVVNDKNIKFLKEKLLDIFKKL